MNKIESIFGAGAWTAVAALLLLATFEPVQVEPKATQVAAAALSQTHG